MSSLEIKCGPIKTEDKNELDIITPDYLTSDSGNESARHKKKTDTVTHGYVHGHIHKHRDHTHIHGHIHNHDHQDNVLESKDSEICRKLDEYTACKNVLCDELDDCFFLNCEDTKENEPIKCTDYCNDDFSEADDLELPKSAVNIEPSNLEVYAALADQHNHYQINENLKYPQNSLPLHHNDNLCKDHLNKKPIFENLINSVHKNLYESDHDSNIEDNKRRKIDSEESLDIHYPHHYHTDSHVDASINGNSNNLNHVHQSCFHTTIPNLQSLLNSQAISDFDFFIQFENFNKLVQNNSIPDITNALNDTNAKIDFQDNSIPDLASTMNGTNDKMLQHLQNNTINSSDLSSSYSCKWNNCFKRVTDSNLMDHIVNQHIQEEYGKNDQVEKFYQCEWNECNFSNSNYDLLVAHLNSHKNDLIFDPLLANNSILSPASTSKSDILSPVIEGSKSNENVSIKAIKISPKYNSCCEGEADPYFTCLWEVGVDNMGNPIKCSKIHDSAGDLQHHLISEHIGSGKSSYSCDWVGCNRHNGHIFTQRQKLLRHIHIHTKYKPCKCDICGASFAVDSMLKQHLRTHSGEKPFSCSICGKKFATSSSLSIHNRVHTGEKPLVCKWPGCNKRFSESSNLTKHMKIHLKIYRCEVCGIEFDKKPIYTKHMKLHDCSNKGTKLKTNIST